jgi:hypothetical protein
VQGEGVQWYREGEEDVEDESDDDGVQWRNEGDVQHIL